jgi:hypothetical protein
LLLLRSDGLCRLSPWSGDGCVRDAVSDASACGRDQVNDAIDAVLPPAADSTLDHRLDKPGGSTRAVHSVTLEYGRLVHSKSQANSIGRSGHRPVVRRAIPLGLPRPRTLTDGDRHPALPQEVKKIDNKRWDFQLWGRRRFADRSEQSTPKHARSCRSSEDAKNGLRMRRMPDPSWLRFNALLFLIVAVALLFFSHGGVAGFGVLALVAAVICAVLARALRGEE